MRKTVFLVLALMVLSVCGMFGNDNSAGLIRRAYIDTLGVPPTVTEMDWLFVYNKGKSYEVAVNYLISNPRFKWNMPKNLAKILLLSNDYRSLPKFPMLPEQVIKNLFYLVGIDNLAYTEENIKTACYKLINIAMVCSDGDTETIDYLAVSMMGRTTNLDEINHLSKIIRNSNKSEKETWYDVLQEIMGFPDTINK